MELDPKKFELDMNCPRCGHRVRAIPETNAAYDISQLSDQHAYLIVRCPRRLCGLSYVEYDRVNKRITDVYPYPIRKASDFHKAIPESIRTDYSEAHKCWYAKSYKGVVVLCRRVLQMVAIDKGAQGNRLIDQIDNLLDKGLITSSIRDSAHEIRFFGNFGAHPQNDGLDNISRDDASTIISFIDQLFMDLYVRPFETKKLSKKRNKK